MSSGKGRLVARCWVLRAESASGTGRVFYYQRNGSGSCYPDAKLTAREFTSLVEARNALSTFKCVANYRIYRRGHRAKVSPVAQVIATLEAEAVRYSHLANDFDAGRRDGLSFAIRELRKVEAGR